MEDIFQSGLDGWMRRGGADLALPELYDAGANLTGSVPDPSSTPMPEAAPMQNPVTKAASPNDVFSGQETGAILAFGKRSFADFTTEGWMQGLDNAAGVYKWLLGSEQAYIDFGVSRPNTLSVTTTTSPSATNAFFVTANGDNAWAGIDLRRSNGTGPGMNITSSSGSGLYITQNSDTPAIQAFGYSGALFASGAVIKGRTSAGSTNPGIGGETFGSGPGVWGFADATSTGVALQGTQDLATSTNFYKVSALVGASAVTCRQWVANNVSPDGNLTGTKGDICQSSNGKLYVNSNGATAWDELPGSSSVGPTPISLAAGEDIAIGDAVAIEATGLFRTRTTGTSSLETGTASGNFANNENTTYNRRRFLSLSETVKVTFGQDSAGGNFYTPYLFRAVVVPSDGTVTSGASSGAASPFADAFYYFDMVQLTGTVAACAYIVHETSGNTYQLCVKSIDFTSGISHGTEYRTAVTSGHASKGLCVERVSDSEIIIAYCDATDARAIQVTLSGGVWTFGTDNVVRASSTFVSAVKRFGTTDNYCFWLSDTPSTMVICGSYSSGTFTMGSETAISSETSVNEPVSAQSYGDSLMTYANIYGANNTYELRTISRSGTALTVNAVGSIGWNNNGGSAGFPCLSKIGDNFFILGGYYLSGGNSSTAWGFYRTSGTSIVALGSIFKTTDNFTTFLAGAGEFCSGRLLAFIGDSVGATDVSAVPVNLTNNHNEAIGFASAAISSGNTGSVNAFSEDVNQSGLTAGTRYYSYLDGELTASKTYGGKQMGIATSSTSILTKT